jgi:hypothetical protein
MTTRKRSLLASALAMGILILPGGASPFGGKTSPSDSAKHWETLRALKIAKAAARQVSPSECAALSFQAGLVKAREEMRALLPAGADDLRTVGSAMDSDPRLSDKIKRTFGRSDLVKSEYSQSEGCVVTVRLPLDDLRRLAKAR